MHGPPLLPANRAITAYNVAVNRAVQLMRSLLPDYGGYECKEPEPGAQLGCPCGGGGGGVLCTHL